MKIYYPQHLDKIMHISKNGQVYQLDSFWKMDEIKRNLESKHKIINIDEPVDSDLFSKFHTPDFVKALMLGIKREELIESCGVFWQPWLPIAMFNQAKAASFALESLFSGGNSSILISSGGHHTTPVRAYGFGPINAIGIAVSNAGKKLISKKIAILDLDVHQSNGFSFIEKPNLKIFDIWNKRLDKWEVNSKNPNYHNYKVNNTDEYFKKLDEILGQIVKYSPDILIYHSGADVIDTDRMGGIPGFTLNKFKERENQVFDTLSKNKIKLLLTIGGGYINYNFPDIKSERQKLVKIHLHTINGAIKRLS